MPELPEVETIAHVLRDGGGVYQTSVFGSVIKIAAVMWPRTLAVPSPEQFSSRIVGQEITGLFRRGKFLVFSLTKDFLLIHLRMSGDLRTEPNFNETEAPMPFKKHDRLALIFENTHRLVFNDTRKFGRVWLVADDREITGGLGPEPFDETLSPAAFHRMLTGRKRQLKPLLMDQRFLAGLGNIYTDEALHLAKLHPLTVSSDIHIDDAERLLRAIRSVLEEGIRRNGASIDWVFRGGDYQNHFRAYGRKDEPCPECGTPIRRLVVGQRGTHICPSCQQIQ